MSVYDSAATSLEQWLNSDILPNLESATTTLEWVRKDVVPNLTGVMAGVSGMVVGLLGHAHHDGNQGRIRELENVAAHQADYSNNQRIRTIWAKPGRCPAEPSGSIL